MAALVRQGLRVTPFKAGPDFIDPGHHTAVTGVRSRNLDGWMLSREYNLKCFQRHTESADIAVVEGVMGLFDGYDGKSEAGSTAQMAKWLGLPIILIVDAKSMARSAAALIQGFENFDRELEFGGVIFNHLGSERHLSYLTEAVQDNVKMPCLGGLIHDEAIAIPERHLGLVTSDDHLLTPENMNRLADFIENNIDLERIVGNLKPGNLKPGTCQSCDQPYKRPSRHTVRIGVARDKAFCFYYQDNLEMLEAAGAEIAEFSPINDDKLPPDIDGLYFGGGYPELFAKQLGANAGLRNEIRKKSRKGMPIYGECGGFMYLCRELCDTRGKTYPMTGCFPFATAMFSRLKSLGYREITLEKDTILGRCGQTVRGHEFHYSEISSCPQDAEIERIYRVTDRSGRKKIFEGYQINQCLGSYIHLHFGSLPDVALHFVEACHVSEDLLSASFQE